MPKPLLLAALALGLAGCSLTAPGGDPVDPLTTDLAALTAEVAAFGGVTFEADRLVVLTLGDAPDAEAAIRARLGDPVSSAYSVRARPAVGRAGRDAADGVGAALPAEHGVSASLDARVGYVRVTVPTAGAALRVDGALRSAGVSPDDVLIQVVSDDR